MATISEIAHNPLNIRATSDKWWGQIGVYKGFVSFESDVYGFRAAFKIIFGYIGLGFDTPRKIISKWAPSSENDVEAYLSFVCNKALYKLHANSPLNLSDLRRLVFNMAMYERGKKPVFTDVVDGFNYAIDCLNKVQTMGYIIVYDREIDSYF